MSWSYNKSGTASSVRSHASQSLESVAKQCSHIPAEAKSVAAFAAAIDAACEQAEGQVLLVEGHGSAWVKDGKLKSFAFHGKIDLIDLSE